MMKVYKMKHVFLILSTFAVCILISGCNTMSGLGKDLKKGGEKLEESANYHKKA